MERGERERRKRKRERRVKKKREKHEERERGGVLKREMVYERGKQNHRKNSQTLGNGE